MAQLVSLAQMRNTVRRMTARYSPQQMQDAQIDVYINLAYTIHFPEQFRNLKLNKPYVFTTVPNVDTYDFVYQNGLANDPAGVDIPGNIQLEPPVYCQGYLLSYFQDKTIFYNRWPKLTSNQQVGSANGVEDFQYTGTIPGAPFLRAQLDIFGNVTETMVIISVSDDTGFNYSISDRPRSDSNIGDLIETNGTQVGEVNYLTGDYFFTPENAGSILPTSLPAGDLIYASIIPYQAARPIDVLFYNQQIVLRPVPLQIYQIEFQISQQPTQLIADGDAPELDEWYLFICCIAAKLVFVDFPDEQEMARLMPIYQEQLQMAQRRTLRQMGNQRVQTIFTTPNRNAENWNYGVGYGGYL